MDEELDLRAFFQAMARHWRLIAIITVVAVVAGGLIALLWPPEYQATATVAVTKPRYVLDFDERLRSLSATSGGTLPLGVVAANAYTALATNESLKAGVLQELGWGMSVEDLSKQVRIKAESGVIQFTGKGPSPQRAATLANTWARLYAEQLNALFSSAAPNITALEGQVSQARAALLQTEQALAEFQARSQITALEKQLEAASTALADRLSLADRLGMLAADARSLQARLQAQPADAPSVAGQFQTLIMEALAVSPQRDLPMQLQLSVQGDALASMSASELGAYLNQLAAALDTRKQQAQDEAQALPTQIAAIQQQLETENNEHDRLLLARRVARDTYESVSRKLDEMKVQAALDEPEVRVVGQAALPSEPAWPKPALVLALALVGGAIVGVLAALIAESLRPRQAD